MPATPLEHIPPTSMIGTLDQNSLIPSKPHVELKSTPPAHVQPENLPFSHPLRTVPAGQSMKGAYQFTRGKRKPKSFSNTLLKLIRAQLGPQADFLNALGNMTLNNVSQGDLLSLSSRLNLTGYDLLPIPIVPKIPSCYADNRQVTLTQYWVPRENEWDETNSGDRVFLGGKDKNMSLFDEQRQLLGTVTPEMFSKCLMEGTCLLESGDMINIDDLDKPTFKLIGKRGRSENIFGLGSGPQTLVPFISVAVNDLPYGQKLYIPELDGLELGDGQQHNGCVRVDDTSWSFDDCQIDFFTPTYIDYLWLDLPKSATIRLEDRCVLKNYVNIGHLIQMKASLDDNIIPSLLKLI
ncbi:hypothetical protein EDC96DRAFT_573373 [Choanephora cucurbitarum]|nr:hypothetical protein EDC96DRAFT_573373 [Choanephora cucurbitarum]